MSGGTARRPFHSACPVCLRRSWAPVVELRSVPVFCNVLFDSAVEAGSATTGVIELVRCDGCTLLYNRAFEPELAEYSPAYENALHHSPTFQEFSERLTARLIETHGITDADVAEIGSGGGSFLEELCRRSGSRGLGFDPSHTGDLPLDGLVEVHPSNFPTDGTVEADLVIARHVLEHLTEPREVAAAVAASLRRRGRGAFYVEVPDGTYMLREVALWDLIYEHCTYFTAAALHRLLTDAGLVVTASGVEFGGQYLWADATPGPGEPVMPESEQPELASRFAQRVDAYLEQWNEQLAEVLDRGRVVIWGAGSKGVTFLNLVRRGADVAAAVDLNPLKHGRFIPGTATPVVGPAELAALCPGSVIVMNPLYRDEVAIELADHGVDAGILVA